MDGRRGERMGREEKVGQDYMDEDLMCY